MDPTLEALLTKFQLACEDIGRMDGQELAGDRSAELRAIIGRQLKTVAKAKAELVARIAETGARA